MAGQNNPSHGYDKDFRHFDYNKVDFKSSSVQYTPTDVDDFVAPTIIKGVQDHSSGADTLKHDGKPHRSSRTSQWRRHRRMQNYQSSLEPTGARNGHQQNDHCQRQWFSQSRKGQCRTRRTNKELPENKEATKQSRLWWVESWPARLNNQKRHWLNQFSAYNTTVASSCCSDLNIPDIASRRQSQKQWSLAKSTVHSTTSLQRSIRNPFNRCNNLNRLVVKSVLHKSYPSLHNLPTLCHQKQWKAPQRLTITRQQVL